MLEPGFVGNRAKRLGLGVGGDGVWPCGRGRGHEHERARARERSRALLPLPEFVLGSWALLAARRGQKQSRLVTCLMILLV